MRPAHRCRAEGGLRFVVHVYDRRSRALRLALREN